MLTGKLAGRTVKFEVDVLKASDGQLELHARGPVEMDVRYDAALAGDVTEVTASVAVRSAVREAGLPRKRLHEEAFAF